MKNDSSTIQNSAASSASFHGRVFQSACATATNRVVSSTNVPVTAMPYRSVNRVEERNTSTSTITPTINAQLTIGTKICPSVSDVCTTRTRGRKPSWTAWRTTENAPLITAWDAITEVSVARTTSGSWAQVGASRKNGLRASPWWPRMSAP